MKTGLVLEGGALRTIFSAGVCDAFLDSELPMPDYTVGVSAGIAYGTSYLSKQKRRNLKLVTTYANDPRYMSMRNLVNPKNRSYFGLKFAYETIPTRLLPFDYDTFEAYPGAVEAVVTNVNTGEAEYLPLSRRDCPNLLLQATCAIPLMFPVIELDGQPYLDGGCADAIPWQHAFDVGCDRVVVILTRERDYRKTQDHALRMIETNFRKYPKFVETMRTRAERGNADRAELFKAEQEGRVFIFSPESTEGFSRTERDTNKIDALWNQGLTHAREKQEALKAFLTQ